MSVCQVVESDFAMLVAIAVRNKFASFGEAMSYVAPASAGNCAALFERYGDISVPVDADEVEGMALRLLADASNPLTDRFCGITYNTVSDNQYWGGIEVNETTASEADKFKALEEKCREWQTAQVRRIERQKQDDAAYADVAPLPMMTSEEIKAMGFDRYVVAEFTVNESDSMVDYYGGRCSRKVLIGMVKSKRDSFKTMRKFAGQFPPTADLGPNCGRWKARSVWSHDSYDVSAVAESQYSDSVRYYKGDYSRFSDSPVFQYESELKDWIAANPLGKGNEYRIIESEIEHRENYSMGGGNYLGESRYGGWKVYQTTYLPSSIEVWGYAPKVVEVEEKVEAVDPVEVEFDFSEFEFL